MNLYADLVKLKQRLEPTGTAGSFTTDYNTPLLQVLNAASRQIDMFTNRRFYVWYGTKYFDGSSDPFDVYDLLSIDSGGFDLDESADDTYGSEVATTDYYLYPLNEWPKTQIKTAPDGEYGGFASGIRKGIRIVGNWGYGDGESASPYFDSGDSVQNDPLTDSSSSLTVSGGGNFGEGQTLLIESEQVYISSISSQTLTILRGVNGTTAASHVQNTTIYIYQYPYDIVEACLIQAMRWWKRKDTAFGDIVGVPELGAISIFKGLDPDVKLILNNYRKLVIV